MPDTPKDLQHLQEIAERFAEATTRYERERRVAAGFLPLGAADLRIIALLIDGVPRTLKQIAEELHLEQSTINRQTNAALQHEYLTRSRGDDGPAYVFSVSQLGRAKFDESLGYFYREYHEAFRLMGADRAQLLVELLEEFVDAHAAARRN